MSDVNWRKFVLVIVLMLAVVGPGHATPQRRVALRGQQPRLKFAIRHWLSFALPTGVHPQQLAWAPDGKRCAVACNSGQILVFPGRKKIFEAKRMPEASTRELNDFDRMLWSPNSRELAFTASEMGGGERELWRLDADGTHLRRVNFDVASFGWSPELTYIKVVTHTGDARITFLAVDDPESAAGKNTTLTSSDGEYPLPIPEAGCYPTAFDAHGRAFFGRRPGGTGLGGGLVRVGLLNQSNGALGRTRDVLLGEYDRRAKKVYPIPEDYYYDRVACSPNGRNVVFSLAGATDSVLAQYIVVVTPYGVIRHGSPLCEGALGSDLFWAANRYVVAVDSEYNRLVAFDIVARRTMVLKDNLAYVGPSYLAIKMPLTVSADGRRAAYVQPEPHPTGKWCLWNLNTVQLPR